MSAFEIKAEADEDFSITTISDTKEFNSFITLDVSLISKNVIKVKYDVSSKREKDAWIGLYDANEINNSKYLRYEYIKKDTGEHSFTNLPEGFYDIRYFPDGRKQTPNNSSSKISIGRHINLTVKNLGIALEITPDYGNELGFIEIYKKNDKGTYVQYQNLHKWVYADGNKSVRMEITDQMKGTYTLIAKRRNQYINILRNIFFPSWHYMSNGQCDIEL